MCIQPKASLKKLKISHKAQEDSCIKESVTRIQKPNKHPHISLRKVKMRRREGKVYEQKIYKRKNPK